MCALTSDDAYALAYRLAAFVELNLNSIRAPSPFRRFWTWGGLDADH